MGQIVSGSHYGSGYQDGYIIKLSESLAVDMGESASSRDVLGVFPVAFQSEMLVWLPGASAESRVELLGVSRQLMMLQPEGTRKAQYQQSACGRLLCKDCERRQRNIPEVLKNARE